MKLIDQLKLVIHFAFNAKIKKDVQEFAYSVLTHKADDTLIEKTKKAYLVDVLVAAIEEQEKRDIARDKAEFLAEVEEWRNAK